MGAEQLQAVLEKNKPVVLGGGLVAVVGLAMWQKRRAGGAAGPDAGAALSAGSQTAAASGGAAYDSSTSDLYNALQPTLESIGQQLDQLQQNPGTIPTPAPPAPTPAPVPSKPIQPVHKVIPTPAPRTGPTPAPKAAPSPLTYVVRPGDSLSKIAARYPSKSITAGSLYSANKATIGGDRNVIHPGQKLTIR